MSKAVTDPQELDLRPKSRSITYRCEGQKLIEEPGPEPNKGLDTGSPEPVSRTLAPLRPSSRRSYHVMKFNELEIESCGHDLRDKRVPPTAKLFKNLRRRMYGALFYDKPGALSAGKFTAIIEEKCINFVSGQNETSQVTPILPPAGSHPGLDNLFDDDYSNVSELRLRLFFHILAPSVDMEEVVSMPDYADLLFPIVVLSCLLHDHEWPLLEDWELDVFIAQVWNRWITLKTLNLEPHPHNSSHSILSSRRCLWRTSG